MFENEQLTTRLTSLFGEAKRSLDIERRYLGVATAQKVARLLGGIAIAAVLIIVGGIVLLFASFALAYWVAELTGSTLLGFGTIALVLALACIVVYVQRQAWIVEPIVRSVAGIIVSPEVAQSSAALDTESTRLEQQRQQAHTLLRTQADGLLQPAKRSASRWESTSNLITSALAIYEGLQMGHSTLKAIRRVFGKRK